MKRITATILALALALVLTACGPGKSATKHASSSSDFHYTNEELEALAKED